MLSFGDILPLEVVAVVSFIGSVFVSCSTFASAVSSVTDVSPSSNDLFCSLASFDIVLSGLSGDIGSILNLRSISFFVSKNYFG